MGQYPKYYKPILKVLEEGPLDGEEIINKIIKGKNKFSPYNRKLYTKAFTRLLKVGKIQIEAYTGNWVQSLNAKDFRYSLVITEPSMISNIIREAYAGNVAEKNKLKSKFIKRMIELKEQNKYRELLLSSAREKKLTEDELSYLESGGLFEYNLYKQIFRKQKYKKIEGLCYRPLLNFPGERNLSYINAKIYFFKPKIIKNVSFRKNPYESIVLDKNFFKKTVKPDKILDFYGILDSPVQFDESFEELFEQIFVFINSQPSSYRKDLLIDFSWALSDDTNANKYLTQLIYQLNK